MSVLRRSTAVPPTRWNPRRYVVVAIVLAAALPGRAAATTADDLCAADANPCTVTTDVPVTDGSVLAFGTRSLVIANGGSLMIDSGVASISAGSITIEDGAEIQATGRNEPGGEINITAATVAIIGALSADGSDGGLINVTAETVGIVGSVSADGGRGGSIVIVATGPVLNGGTISANGMSTSGGGGNVELMGGTLTVAGDISARGAGDSLGGCVTLNADHDIALVRSIRVSGGDGGEILVVAGLMGGNLSISPAAVLSASGTGTNGGSAGGIELSARGDGVETGHVSLDGALQSRAGSLQGGDGGCITVSADGDIIGASSTAQLNANSGTPDGFAGEISIAAAGNVMLKTELSAQGSGSEGAGGDIEVSAGGDLVVEQGGRMSVAGPGDGGSIDLSASRGEMSVRSGASVDASGTITGDGGDIRLRASGDEGRVVVAGTVSANGTSSGRGGAVDMTAGDTFELIGPATTAGGQLQAQGGTGGTITMRTLRGALRVEGKVLAGGSASTGGTIAAVSASDLIAAGQLDAEGNSQAGSIGLEANGPVTVAGIVTAASALDGSGGQIEVIGAGSISVTGDLNADGGVSVVGGGGDVALRGCDVSLASGSAVSAKGNAGINRIVGRRLITVGGMLMADNSTGRNEFVYRDAASPPIVFGSASIVPTVMLTLDPTLEACSVCGDRQVEPPETCDDGNQDDGDGCSSTCQIEAAPCDVDGDGDIDLTDLRVLESELFDGDGERTLDVGGGAIAGTVGADGNEDGRITSADLTQCIEVLGNI